MVIRLYILSYSSSPPIETSLSSGPWFYFQTGSRARNTRNWGVKACPYKAVTIVTSWVNFSLKMRNLWNVCPSFLRHTTKYAKRQVSKLIQPLYVTHLRLEPSSSWSFFMRKRQKNQTKKKSDTLNQSQTQQGQIWTENCHKYIVTWCPKQSVWLSKYEWRHNQKC